MKNPVLWLELRVRIRERKLWIVSGLYLLCLAGMSLLGLMMVRGGHHYEEQEPARLGGVLFACGAFSLLALLMILGPLAGAGCLTQEREQRTLPALLNTVMPIPRIVWGKLVSAWIFLFWLVSLGVPFLALAVFWSGVEWWKLLGAVGILLAAGMTAASIAVGFSGFFRRTLTSYLACGAVMFLWLVVWPIMGTLLEVFAPGAAAERLQFVRFQYYVFWAHHPLFPMLRLIMPEGTGLQEFHHGYLVAFGVWLVIGLLSFALACRSLARGLIGKS